jgi:hypothetical protein
LPTDSPATFEPPALLAEYNQNECTEVVFPDDVYNKVCEVLRLKPEFDGLNSNDETLSTFPAIPNIDPCLIFLDYDRASGNSELESVVDSEKFVTSLVKEQTDRIYMDAEEILPDSDPLHIQGHTLPLCTMPVFSFEQGIHQVTVPAPERNFRPHTENANKGRPSRIFIVENPSGPQVRMRCTMCRKIVKSQLEASEHLRTYHIRACFVCSFVGPNHDSFEDHRTTYHQKRNRKCRRCAATCTSWSNMEAHFVAKHLQAKNRCTILILGFVLKKKFSIHHGLN